MKKLLTSLLLTLALVSPAVAQSTIPQGGTGLSTSTVGDLLVGTSSIRYSRLPVGASGTVLQASSTSPFRMAWATISSIFSDLLASNNTWTGTNTFNATTSVNANFAVDTDTLYVDSTNNRVGIGTTTPTNKLDIWGGVTIGTGTTPLFLASTLKNGVSLGTNLLATNERLHVYSGASGQSVFRHSSGLGGVTITGDAVGSSATLTFGNNYFTSFSEKYRIFMDGTDFSLKFQPNATPGSVGATTTMTLLSSGNVGIGTTNPNYKLEVVGTSFFNGTANFGGTYTNFGGGYGAAGTSIDANGNISADGNLVLGGNLGIGTTTPSSLLTVSSSTMALTSSLFSIASTTEIFRVNANGRVGINTGSPSAVIHAETPVQNSTTVTAQYLINRASGSGAGTRILMGYNTTAAASGGISSYYSTAGAIGMKTGLEAGGVTFLTGQFNGDVGVGTTSPYAKFAIQGTSGSTTPLFIVASSTGSTPYFQVTAAGNVGIGTASPGYKLDVTGSINITGDGNYLRWGAGDAQISETGHKLGFSTWTGSALTEKMSILGGGNVGIGTTTPTSLLTVASSTVSSSYSILGIFNSLTTPIMNILGSGAVLFGATTTANCGNAPCGLTVATTTQFTAGVVSRVVGYSSAASTTINLDTTDAATTTINQATTFVNPTGTAYDVSMFQIIALATTTQTIYWGNMFASSSPLTLPSTIASGTNIYLFQYNKFTNKLLYTGFMGPFN